MKFKATLRDHRTLSGICQACRNVNRRCVLRLHPSRLRLYATDDGNNNNNNNNNINSSSGLRVWASCRTATVLTEYHAASREVGGAIYCEISDISRLLRVLRHAERCPRVAIRLTKNNMRRPVLRVAMHGAIPHLDISHDVPVRILTSAAAAEFNLAATPLEMSGAVSLILPGLTELARFVEKIRATSCGRLTFTATNNNNNKDNNTCSLVIDAECFLGSFALKYNAVQLCERDEDDDEEEEENENEQENNNNNNNSSNGDRDVGRLSNNTRSSRHNNENNNSGREEVLYATVSVDVRRFARFLSMREVTPVSVVLYLVDSRAVVLNITAAGGTSLLGYMPAMMQ